MPRRKVCTDRPLECRAQPAVGSTWLEPGAVVAEADRGPRADEDRSGVTDPRIATSRGVARSGSPGARRRRRRPPAARRRRRRRARCRDCGPASASVTRSRCSVVGDLHGELGVDGVGERDAVGDQHAGGDDVVLGLADQVGRDVHRVGGVVGQDGDLGGAGLGVDADLGPADPLGGGDVDVARAGDHVDRRQLGAVGVGAAVGQQRHRLRAADRPHLVDPEQRGRGQDGRVRQAAEVAPAAGWPPPATPPRRPGRARRSSPRCDG